MESTKEKKRTRQKLEEQPSKLNQTKSSNKHSATASSPTNSSHCEQDLIYQGKTSLQHSDSN